MPFQSLRSLNLNHLYYFHTIATSGSLTEGAKKLNVTQPTLSQQIMKLESSLNLSLFNRESKGLSLTTNGEVLLDYTQRIFSLTEEALSTLNYQKYQSISKMYRVGTSQSLPAIVISHTLQPLLEGRKFGIKVCEDSTESLFTKLEKRELDFIISEHPGTDRISNPDIVARKIHSQDFRVVIGPKADETEFLEGGLDALCNKSYFKMMGTHPQQRQFDRLFLTHGVTPNVVGESNDIGTIAAFTASNDCFSIVPSVALQSFKELKPMMSLDIPDQPVCVFSLGDRDSSEIDEVIKLLGSLET